ncbi:MULTISPECIES: hypothetical protein [Sphingobium]|uniref:NAD(P)(+) transhydrogenase (Re/Si-specific) subunit beta n=1 Tax=Sphingobium tyrosinilyticum TaxID=2715436 RepID=A0ABV9F3T1_9SPHN|nr:hypothetical protein [Sphingobium sp. EP60837]ANI78546.1 NAD(P)(+) transhydrogenase (Re/Si-specific) [Sphingobium sp. EP60837]
MSNGIDAITLAWAIAVLLLVLSLWPPGGASERLSRHAATAAILLLMAAAFGAMDVINMPEIMGALIIGAAVGLLLARKWPGTHMIMLMAALAGLSGTAAICAAAAAWINPYAFGLIDEGANRISSRDMLTLGLTLLTGGSACALASTVAIRRSMAGAASLALTIAMAGWSAAALAFLLQNVAMIVAGGLAGAAGTGVALRICGGARGKGLADGERRP